MSLGLACCSLASDKSPVSAGWFGARDGLATPRQRPVDEFLPIFLLFAGKNIPFIHRQYFFVGLHSNAVQPKRLSSRSDQQCIE